MLVLGVSLVGLPYTGKALLAMFFLQYKHFQTGIKVTSLALTHFFQEQSQFVWLLSTNNIQLHILWSNLNKWLYGKRVKYY